MAVVFEGFSIREYASKMRSVNAAKCWPFDEEDKESKREESESLLPPITCRKYRWWSNELEILKSKSAVDDEEEKEKAKNILEESKPLSEVESGFESGNHPIEEQEADLRREKVVLENEKAEEEKVVMVCPVCQIFTASTVNAVNVHIDSCLSKASKKEKKQIRKAAAAAAAAKAKSKTRKKRSIVEIFAVAPQIENLEVEEEDDEDEEQEQEEEALQDGGRFNEVVKRTKKSKGRNKSTSKVDVTMIMRNLKLKNEKKNKSKNKKTIDRSSSANSKLNKEKNHKHKVPLPAAFLLPCKGPLLNKTLEREISDDVAIRKKKPSKKKSLPMQNKPNTIQGSKLISQHQQGTLPVFPVHSILKNQIRAISSQKSSAVGNLQGCEHTNLRSIQQSDRHVRFSGKDDILGPTIKQCSSFELPQIQTHHKVLSEVMDDALVTDLSLEHDEIPPTDEAREVNGGDEDVISITSAAGSRSTHEKKWLDDLNDHVSPSFLSPNNSSCRDKGKDFSDESLDQTQAFQHHDDFHFLSRDNSTAFYKLPSAGMPRFLNSTLNEGFHSNVETQTGGDVQGAEDTGGSLHDPFVDSVPRSAAMSSLPNINAISQPYASCLTSNTEVNGRQRFLSQTTRHTSNGGALEYQPLCHLSSKDLMDCISSSVEWKKRRGAICGGKYIDDDFIGLPLNSQGELIQFSSSGKVGYNHLKKQDIMVGTSSSFPTHNLLWPNKEKQYVERTHPRDHLKLFPEKNYFRENPKVPVPSRLGITEMQGTGRTEVHWQDSLRGSIDFVHQLSSDLNLMKVSGYGCKQCRSTANQSENEKLQSEESSECGFLPPNQTTMRLMGKNVTVGRTNKEGHGFEDGSIWTDKEIITEHRPSMTPSDNSSFYRHPPPEWIVHQVSQKSKEIASHSWKAQTTSPEVLQMKAAESRSAHSYLNWQTPLISQTGIPFTSKNHSQELQSANSLPSNSLMNRTSNVPESSISQNQSLNMGSRIPMSSTTPHNACDHMRFSSAQFKSNQSMAAHGETSSFLLPFSGQDCTEYVQPSWCQSSSQRLPQWLINAKQQRETPPTLSKTFSDTSAAYQPCTMSGPSILAISSPYHKSMISYPHNLKTSFRSMQNSSGGTSLFHPPLIPAPPGFRRAFSINSCSKKKIKVKDGRKAKCSFLNDFDHAKKAKKRPAAKANDSARSFKKPNWQSQESNAKLGLKHPADFTAFPQCNSGPSEPNAYSDKGSDVGYSQVEIQKDGLKTSTGANFPKLDAVARSGPIKLSAGAKYILKPNQNMAQDYSRPTHSTIPFEAVTNASKVSVFQKKPAQIYRSPSVEI
ncbi:hypothetical protein BVC80_9021g8 [Macleaya cordata]|uniref:UBZ4-type domain-containing protein n=1 Tax=Macleaya cordata TaxID=56857 RepID=A0A200QV05_MACCD|nr:hypothetical protein BVC80_9021g8 [Macleaya cordata]